jgi:MscS family membrane protein
MGRVCLLATLLFATLSAQIPTPAPAPAPAAPPEAPKDALGRTSPRGTVLGFLAAAGKGNMEAATQYLNTPLRGKSAEDLAQKLFTVLDRRLPAKLLKLSDSPEGSLATLKPGQDLVGTIPAADGDIDILVELVPVKEGPRWLFAKETLGKIPTLFEELDEVPINNVVPEFLLTTRFAGVLLFQWLFVFVGLPALYFAMVLLNRLLGLLIGSVRRRVSKKSDSPNPNILIVPVRLALILLVMQAMLVRVALPLLARQFWSTTETLISIVAGVWLSFLIVRKMERLIRRRLVRTGNIGAFSMVRMGRGAVDLLFLFAGLMAVLYLFGIRPTTALAGVGIGGIAVAVAAQKSLENLLGGVSIVFDQVVRVAEFLKIGDIMGTVVEVGWRSTSIRTLDRSVVSIPNGQLANLSLENLSSKDKFWFNPSVRLRYDTTAAQLRSILAGLNRLLKSEARIEPASIRVRFTRLGTSSLDLDIFAYVMTRDLLEFLKIQEELLLAVLDTVEAAGAHIALQSPVYLDPVPASGTEQPGSMRRDDLDAPPGGAFSPDRG